MRDIIKWMNTVILSIWLSFLPISCAATDYADSSPTNQNQIQEEISYDMAGSLSPAIGYQKKEGDIVVYTLSKLDFRDFLRGQSIYENLMFTAYRKSNAGEGYVEVETYTGNGIGKYESDIASIGPWPVYTEFIDFMNDPENFRQILSERGIDEELLSYDIIEHIYLEFKDDELPPPGSAPMMCIWLHTDAGDYFLEFSPDYDNLHSTTFTYKFHNLSEYAKKYGK